MKNFIKRYKINNLVKKFEETKAKRQQWEVKYNLMKIEELEDKLDNHEHKDSCECYLLREQIREFKDRLKDEVISNETDLLLNTRC